jgi:putative ABC transport system ATP-binding protein
MLTLRDIRKSYKLGDASIEILRGVNLEVAAGDLMAILGPSGCGKSTLMHIIGLLDVPTSGSFHFDGQDVSNLTDIQLSTLRNQKLGFVFQQFYLIPKLTALDNVALPLLYRGMAERERREIAQEMLTRVGMGERLKHKPKELSGGQQQRVAIARAIAGKPAVILADEPTGALDSNTSREIMALFKELNEQDKITLVLITHDPGVGAQCRRQVRMKDGVILERA